MPLRRIAFLALLTGSLAGFLAAPAHAQRGFGSWFGVRNAALEREEPQREPLPPQAAQQLPRIRPIVPADAGSYGAQSDSMPQDSRQRQGILTPEERRALRRQIDEVGHDIDTPRR